MDDLNELIEGAENPVTEGNSEDFQENFENLPDIEPQETTTTTTTNNQQLAPEGRSQTEERNPLNFLPEVLKPTNLKAGYDAATGLVNGQSDDVFREVNANIVDWVDNTFQGNQRTKEEILANRDRIAGQAQVRSDAIGQNLQAGPNAVSETVGIPIGAALGNLEAAAELSELAGDALALIPRWATGQLDATQIPFHNKYEWANWNLGREQMGAKSGVGQFAQGLLQFAGILRATGGLKGLEGTRHAARISKGGPAGIPTSKVLQRVWKRSDPLTRAGMLGKAGEVGARAGVMADVITTITDPEQSNLSNLIEQWNPDLKDSWITALSVDEDDSMAEAVLKTALEGYGLGYAADAVGVVLVGNRVFRRLGEVVGLPPEQRQKIAVVEAQRAQRLLEPHNPPKPEAGTSLTSVLDPETTGQDFILSLGGTQGRSLYDLDETLETLRSYPIKDQEEWYLDAVAANGTDSRKILRTFLSFEAQWKLGGSSAERYVQLPNGTQLLFHFHKIPTSWSGDANAIEVSWDVSRKGRKGTNIKKGIDPLDDYSKKWKAWKDTDLETRGPRPERPEEEAIGGWGKFVISQIQEIARTELKPGQVLDNSPIQDADESAAQIRRRKKLGEDIQDISEDQVRDYYNTNMWNDPEEPVWASLPGLPRDIDTPQDALRWLQDTSDNQFRGNRTPFDLLDDESREDIIEMIRNVGFEYGDPTFDISMNELDFKSAEINIRSKVYKRAGFGDLFFGGQQLAMVRKSPDARGRWITPLNPVLTDGGSNFDDQATKAVYEALLRENIDPFREAEALISKAQFFDRNTGEFLTAEDVYPGRSDRFAKLWDQSKKGIPITWDDVRATFPEYFVTGPKVAPTELARPILDSLEALKRNEIATFIKDPVDGSDLEWTTNAVDIDGVSLNKFDEDSINSFLTKNAQLLTREDVVFVGGYEKGKPIIKIERSILDEYEAKLLGILFDQKNILRADFTHAGQKGEFNITNYALLYNNPQVQAYFKEVYIDNYRQADWDQYMTPGGSGYSPGEYERAFDRMVGDDMLDLARFKDTPGIEITRPSMEAGTYNYEAIDTFGSDQLKETKGNHLASILETPHEFRTVQPVEAAAQQLEATQAPPGRRTGSQRTLTRAQIRLLSEGAPDGIEGQIRELVADTPIRLNELSELTQLSEGEIFENATKAVADALDIVTGEIDFKKLDVSEYGSTGDVLLTRTGIVQTRMLMQEMSKGIWESAYNIVKQGDAGADSFKQMELMVQQWKVLARTYKVSANAHSHLLRASAIKLPWGGTIPNPVAKTDLSKVSSKLKDGEKVLDELVERLKTGDTAARREAMKIANALLLSDGDIHITNKLWQYVGELSVGQGLKIMYNSLLSGPATHLVNTISNVFNTVYRPITAATGGDIKQRKAALSGFYGFQQTIKDSWEMANRVTKNGGKAINDGGKGIMFAAETTAKLDLLHKAATASDDDGFRAAVGFVDMSHKVAEFPLFSWPSNLLVTSDEFFKTMSARMEYNSRMMEIAIEEAGTGKNADDIFKKLLKDNLDTNFDAKTGQILNEDLLNVAKEVTFQSELEGPARYFAHFINEAPALRIFFPFVKTGHNIMVFAGTHTPVLNRFLTEYKTVMAGDDAYAKAVMNGREAYGRFMVVGGALAAYNGLITGNGPADPDAKKLWLKTHQPRSIKVGDAWIRYDRLEPLGQILAGTADIMYAFQTGKLSEDRAQYLAGYLTYSFAANLTQKSFFQGLVPLGKLLTPGWQGISSLTRVPLDTLNNFIPLASARRTFANMHTPYLQEFNNQFDRFLNQVTWGAVKGSDRVDWLTGEKIGNDSGMLNSILPYKVNRRGDSIVHDRLEDIEFDSSSIVKELGGIDLTVEQQNRLAEIMGKSGMYHELKKWLTHPEFDGAVEDFKSRLREGQRISKTNEYFYRETLRIIRSYRNSALEQLRTEFPELDADINEQSLLRYQQRSSTKSTQTRELANF